MSYSDKGYKLGSKIKTNLIIIDKRKNKKFVCTNSDFKGFLKPFFFLDWLIFDFLHRERSRDVQFTPGISKLEQELQILINILSGRAIS